MQILKEKKESDFPRRKSLRILPQEAPLRGESPFLKRMPWPPETEEPRALRALARIVDGGLCHRCGSCIGICPTSVLDTDDDEYPRIKNLSACTDCDLCVRVCPGDEFDYLKWHRERFNEEGDLKSTHGHFLDAVIAHSTDSKLRELSTSGGLVTELLRQLMRNGQIDGAVVIVSDPVKLWRGKPIVARTEEELLSATKSKYAIAPTNRVFSEIREMEGRYVLVGLPCQIHGYIKAAELDQRLKERIVLTIGLFCHAAIEHEAFETIWDSLGEKAKRAKRFISRIGKHPGAPHIELDDGTLYPVYFGDRQGYRPSSMEVINILYRLYTPHRCLTCFDALSDLADISVGDPWMPPPEDDVDFYKGWSFALIRTARGKEVFEAVRESGALNVRTVTRKEALQCNNHMASEKRWRAFRIIETHRRQGKAIPAYGPYGLKLPRHSGIQFIKTEANMLSHAFCFIPRYRRLVLEFFLGDGGYWFLWLNNRRRTLKFWLRDTIARLKRHVTGRR
ncbi:MAG: 4Fe-4S dicluster domain-containing protein [Candidatus Dadabacteria bacterium]|nr:MAG: 4Fe-4S dicluster domain-containing protein [Candidatus Dadabacteria bacterium]